MSCEEIISRAADLLVQNGIYFDKEFAAQNIITFTKFADEASINTQYARMSWDEYFMSLAFLVRMRSPDAQTQHGCVIVDNNNKIVTTGYNGFLPEASDDCIPNTRPHKHPFVMHAEANAILSAAQNLSGCRIYVTGMPCNDCLKIIIKSGIRKVIVGDIKHVVSNGYFEMQSLLCIQHNVEIVKYVGKIANLAGRTISEEDHRGWNK